MAPLLGFEEVKTARLWVSVLTEMLGTMLLVTVGCGSCMYAAPVLHAALAFGVCVAVIVWCTAHVSGGNINPAVTAGFLVTRKMSLTRAAFYMLGQCLGATLGAALLLLLTPIPLTPSGTYPLPALSGPRPRGDVSWFQVVGIESLLTFLLLLAVFATCDHRRVGFTGCGPVVIGLSITMGHLWAVPLTGAASNPAAAFGTALVFGPWKMQWAYWLGGLNGGMLAALLYDLVLATNAGRSKARAFFTRRQFDDDQFEGPRGEAEANEQQHELATVNDVKR